jgi:ubiquinone biosynthesis protein UbiJ
VTVTARELELLRDETFADPEYADRFAESRGRWAAGFTASELDDILGHVAAAANHARRDKLREELDALYERLEALERARAGSDHAF